MAAPSAFADLVPQSPQTSSAFADLVPSQQPSQPSSFSDLVPQTQPDQSNSAFDPAMWSKVQGMKRGTLEHPSENYLTLTHIGSQLGFLGIHGFEKTGHDPNGAHPTGDAVDFRTRDKSWEEGNQFISTMRKMGLTVIDERNKPGQPHIHVQVPRGGVFKGDFTPFNETPPTPVEPAQTHGTPIPFSQAEKEQMGQRAGVFAPGTGPSTMSESSSRPGEWAPGLHMDIPKPGEPWYELNKTGNPLDSLRQSARDAQSIINDTLYQIGIPIGPSFPGTQAAAELVNPLNQGNFALGAVMEPGKTMQGMAESVQNITKPGASLDERIGGIFTLAMVTGGLHGAVEGAKSFGEAVKSGDLGLAGKVLTDNGVHPELAEKFVEKAGNEKQIEDLTNQRIEVQARTLTKSGKPKANVNPKDQALLNTLDSQIQALKPSPVSETAPNVQTPAMQMAYDEVAHHVRNGNPIIPFADAAKKYGVPLDELKRQFVNDPHSGWQIRQEPSGQALSEPLAGQPYYHGHREQIGKFTATDASDYSTHLFGEGIYFTDDAGVANKYAKVGTSRVGISPDAKLVSADKPTPSEILREWEKTFGAEPGSFKPGKNFGSDWKDIENDYAGMTGDSLAEVKADLSNGVIKAGYDGITHKANARGGWRTTGNGATNNVVILYKTDRISPYEPKATETAPSAPANTVSRETPVLQSAIIPGAKEFIEQDVVPSIESGIEGARQIASDIKQGLNPAGIDEPSKLMAGVIRDRNAERGINTARIGRSLDSALKTMGKMPEAEQYDFIHKMESGAKQNTPEMDVVSKALRSGLDDRAKQVQGLGIGALKVLIQDYFPHTWERPKQNIVQAVFGKRPLQGPASFIKKRTIPTTADGLAAGLKPVTTNPVELTLLKIHEMDRFLMAHRIFKEAKATKEIGIKFVKWNGDVPDGYVKLNDRIAKVYEGVTGQGSLAQRGDYYAPAGAAKVFNNYLSPGLSGVRAYNWARVSGNVLNQAQLGMSAFHLGFTAMDAVTSKVALSLELGSRKQFGKAALEAAKVPTAAFETYFKGDKLLKAIYKNDPSMAQYTDALQKAGGAIRQDRFYHSGAIDGLKKALKNHNYIGAGVRAPFAVIEAVAKPVMEHAVPRMKLGVFFDLARMELARLGPNATDAVKRDVLGKVWDSVDNRMGQMTYDNLFWDKTAKDLAMVSVRSVGWNLGTIRELGGAALDTATVLKRIKQGDPWLTHRMAYAAALPVTTALVGSIVNYLYTGKGPDSLLDAFYPKTGQKNLDGTDERMQLPTYMKEIYPVASALAHTGADGSWEPNVSRAVQHIGDAATAKVHPLLSASIQMMRNKDYYGAEIRHGGDPIVKQLLAEAGFAGSQFLPFSVRNIQKTQEQTGKTNLAPLVGITPAPRNLSKSDALLKAQEIMNKMGDAAKTSAEQQTFNAKQKLLQEIERKEVPPNQIAKRATELGLTKVQAGNIIKESKMPRIAYLARQMTIDDAYSVYEVANKQEKAQLLPILHAKLKNMIGEDGNGSNPAGARKFREAHPEFFSK